MRRFMLSRSSTALLALATLVLDQLSKWVMLSLVYPAQQPPIVVTEFFSLVMVWNRGVSFGMLNRPDVAAATPYFILLVSLVVVAVLVRMALRSASGLERIGYALVVGGALGNVVDRLRFGAVADFFYFHLGALGWPAFNIADSAICIGVFILLIATLGRSKVDA